MSLWIEALTEGTSDVPVIEELMQRHFGLRNGHHFRVHPHKGKGKLPTNPLSRPDPKHQGLLDQLPAKLRGFGASLGDSDLVLVLIDLDDDDRATLFERLNDMLARLPRRPKNVLFRFAVEETESWFLADRDAITQAYPSAKLKHIKNVSPDAIVGAWELLAKCLGAEPASCAGPAKTQWSRRIAPHLNFQSPRSPSLRELIESTQTYIATHQA